MAFSDFRYPDLLTTFGLTDRAVPQLFDGVPPLAGPPALRDTLAANTPLAVTINTEKARAEWLVAPVLGEFWRRYGGRVSLYSGTVFPADPDAGLTGFCDFLIGRGPHRPVVAAPLLVVFEAKNESIQDGLGQCIAGMVGVQRFNRRQSIDGAAYGCVTTGTNWKFLQLVESVVTIDMNEYLLPDVDKILGILAHMVGPLPLPQPAAAA